MKFKPIVIGMMASLLLPLAGAHARSVMDAAANASGTGADVGFGLDGTSENYGRKEDDKKSKGSKDNKSSDKGKGGSNDSKDDRGKDWGKDKKGSKGSKGSRGDKGSKSKSKPPKGSKRKRW